jgi:hypothetical protein
MDYLTGILLQPGIRAVRSHRNVLARRYGFCGDKVSEPIDTVEVFRADLHSFERAWAPSRASRYCSTWEQ